MDKNRNTQQQERRRKRDSTRAVARVFAAKQSSIRQQLGIPQIPPKPIMEKRLNFCSVRTIPRRFGISFIVPDRVAAEINDNKRVLGKHPMRIARALSGGPTEFHKMVLEAEKESQPLKKREMGKRPNPKSAYHRCRLNDWHPQVFYFTPWS